MNIFSILSSAFSFRFPSFRFSGGKAKKIGKLTGRTGISLKQVNPSYILNFGKQVLCSLKEIQTFYRTQLKGVFNSNKINPLRFFMALGVALEESASYIGFQFASYLFSRNASSSSLKERTPIQDYSSPQGKHHYHPMKLYTVFSSALNRANDDACHLKQSGMVSDLKTAGVTLGAMKVADELELLISERRQSSPLPSAPPYPDEPYSSVSPPLPSAPSYLDETYSSVSPVPSAPPYPDEPYSSVPPLPSAPPYPDEPSAVSPLPSAPASFLMSSVLSFSEINTECPITFEKFNWDTFVFTKFDTTPDGKICRVYLKSAIEQWVEEHGTHPVLRNQEISVNDFQNVKDYQTLVTESF